MNLNQPETLAALSASIARLAAPAGTSISRREEYSDARWLLRKLALASFDSVVDSSAGAGKRLSQASECFREIAADIPPQIGIALENDLSQVQLK